MITKCSVKIVSLEFGLKNYFGITLAAADIVYNSYVTVHQYFCSPKLIYYRELIRGFLSEMSTAGKKIASSA